ncbi:hypothetical protein C8Q74DRAFT_1198986 [Fomes fomentarius]|nr:hypothetical protein C8Q74DRAFT_1198986 [Fomes fomentarius]
MWARWWIRCADWKPTPKWRNAGFFCTPKQNFNPLLLVSNQYDPVCPLTHTRRVQERFGDAGLLTQSSHGHLSVSSPCLCTAKRIREWDVAGGVNGL